MRGVKLVDQLAQQAVANTSHCSVDLYLPTGHFSPLFPGRAQCLPYPCVLHHLVVAKVAHFQAPSPKHTGVKNHSLTIVNVAEGSLSVGRDGGLAKVMGRGRSDEKVV